MLSLSMMFNSNSKATMLHIKVKHLRRFHAAMTMLWLVLAIPSVLWWKTSILWVIILSVWANVASHFGAWQAARAEDAAGNEKGGE